MCLMALLPGSVEDWWWWGRGWGPDRKKGYSSLAVKRRSWAVLAAWWASVVVGPFVLTLCCSVAQCTCIVFFPRSSQAVSRHSSGNKCPDLWSPGALATRCGEHRLAWWDGIFLGALAWQARVLLGLPCCVRGIAGGHLRKVFDRLCCHLRTDQCLCLGRGCLVGLQPQSAGKFGGCEEGKASRPEVVKRAATVAPSPPAFPPLSLLHGGSHELSAADRCVGRSVRPGNEQH